MGFEAQASLRLLFLMAIGTIFAVAGLWLLLRPKQSGTAKIELFGLKFESSSAGVLVFLIGSLFLAVPLVVPEKPGGPGRSEDQTNLTVVDPQRSAGTTDGGNLALVLPADPATAEIEPNERIQDANQIALGQTVSGKLRKGDEDWFVVAVPDGPAYVDLRVRKLSGEALRASLHDAHEELIHKDVLYDVGSENFRGEAPGNDRFYVRLWPDPVLGDTEEYEVTYLPVSE